MGSEAYLKKGFEESLKGSEVGPKKGLRKVHRKV